MTHCVFAQCGWVGFPPQRILSSFACRNKQHSKNMWSIENAVQLNQQLVAQESSCTDGLFSQRAVQNYQSQRPIKRQKIGTFHKTVLKSIQINIKSYLGSYFVVLERDWKLQSRLWLCSASSCLLGRRSHTLTQLMTQTYFCEDLKSAPATHHAHSPLQPCQCMRSHSWKQHRWLSPSEGHALLKRS